MDSQNPVGSTLGAEPDEQLGDPMWMGSPLLVHRRCISPMFDISNRISYEGAMLEQTPAPKPSEVGTFCLPTSFWLEVSGRERGAKNHFVEAQAAAIAPYVADAFRRALAAAGDTAVGGTAGAAGGAAAAGGEAQLRPSVYLISPFTSVVRGLKTSLNEALRSSLTAEEERRADVSGWVKACIGTVHTFQGKEANEVFLVLGCDASAKGAVQWVKPNIINVAATRAKYRFCAVGDASVWEANADVRTLVEMLGSWLATQAVMHEGKLAEADDAALEAADYPPREGLPTGMEERPSFDGEDTWCVVDAASVPEAASAAAPAPSPAPAPVPSPVSAAPATATPTMATAPAAHAKPTSAAPATTADNTENPYVDLERGTATLDDPYLSVTNTLKYLSEREDVDTGAYKRAGDVNTRLKQLGALGDDRLPTAEGLAHGIHIGRWADGTTFAVYDATARAWLRQALGL